MKTIMRIVTQARLQAAVTALVLLVGSNGTVIAADGQNARRPAVLIDSWGGDLDLAYMKQLQAAGFDVDAVSHDQLTWERIKQYHVLMLLDFPAEGSVLLNPSGGPASGNNLDQTLTLVDRYLQAGGGVLIDLVQHANGTAVSGFHPWYCHAIRGS
jgi:hypothetical protein